MREEDSIADANYSPPDANFFPFRHQELLNSPATGHPWDQKKLVNKLNHLNFIDSFVFLIVREKNSGIFYLLKAYPQPCVKDELICRVNAQSFLSNVVYYSIEYLMIDDGLNATLAPVNCISAHHNIIKLSLPEHCQIKKLHKTRRYYCKDVSCELVQDSFKARGILIDFTPTAFSILLDTLPDAESFLDDKRVELTLFYGNKILFTGPCNIIRNSINSDKLVVLTPEIAHLERFPKRKMRNPRHVIKPSFILRFNHPLFQKKIERDIQDISTAGFSIIDSPEEEVLIPGLHIPEATIVYAGVLKIPCSIQVLYRREDKNNNCVYFGLTITDMDLKSYTNLNHILGTYVDGNARVSTEVDMDALWEFFFDTGFIYGDKYQHLYSYRKDFKNIYEKLYLNSPDIAKHFIYEKNGTIYGHIAMIHAYKYSWLIHHFNARQMGSRLPGITVLKQLTQFISHFMRIDSFGMNHVMTYYQPSNKVIDGLFGSFARRLNNPRGSSLDFFSYILFKNQKKIDPLPANWYLKTTTDSTIKILTEYYDSCSGGLLINALGLNENLDSFFSTFSKSGFKRNYFSYCLFYRDKPLVFFIINQSNMGINLSDLLNCIKIIILDYDIDWEKIILAVNNLSVHFQEINIPLLIFPSDYLSFHNIKTDKNYTLWILNLKTDYFSDDYLSFMNKLMRLHLTSI